MESIKVAPSQLSVLKASPSAAGPSDANCLMQIAHVHSLKDSELNYDKHRLDLSMRMLRNHEGLNAPIKINMELHAARQIGRLPFLQSSNLMEDVLLGRDETIDFSDYLGSPENCEVLRQPHAVVEKTLGIL